MLYEFKSKAAGTVTMTGPVAERLLGIVGKAPGPQGVFTVEQMGPAIAALEEAIAREKAERGPDDADDDGPRDADGRRAISLAQRAWPLLDLLRTARAAEQVVTWGV
jgi:cyclopropane-fatty-acyl-phospholipid synthase